MVRLHFKHGFVPGPEMISDYAKQFGGEVAVCIPGFEERVVTPESTTPESAATHGSDKLDGLRTLYG